MKYLKAFLIALALILAPGGVAIAGNNNGPSGGGDADATARSSSDASARSSSQSGALAGAKVRSTVDVDARSGDSRATGGDATGGKAISDASATGGNSKATGGKSRSNAQGGTARAAVEASGNVRNRTTTTIEGDTIDYGDSPTVYEATAAAPPQSYATSESCNTSGIAVQGNNGGFSMGTPSYACDVHEIHDALVRLETGHCLTYDEAGKVCTSSVAHGFFDGTVPAFFLRGQLVTKGLFKMIMPL